MPDSVAVTTRESWLSRLGKAPAGLVIGLVMVVAAFPLLWWNEGRAVHRARSLQEGASLAWLAYRPLLAGGLLVVAAGAFALLVRSRRPKRVVPPPIPVGRV
jgi:hypothetical protein